jgi:hypothetical protein
MATMASEWVRSGWTLVAVILRDGRRVSGDEVLDALVKGEAPDFAKMVIRQGDGAPFECWGKWSALRIRDTVHVMLGAGAYGDLVVAHKDVPAAETWLCRR